MLTYGVPVIFNDKDMFDELSHLIVHNLVKIIIRFG